MNILDGKFKHLKVKSDKFSYNGLYFSDLNIETKCKYNHISFLDETLKFEEDMILKYSLNITQDDLSKIANSKEYKKIIEKMNSDKTVSSLIQIQNSNFEIRKNKIYIKYSIIPSSKHDVIAIITKNIKPLKISIGADLRVVDGKIELCNLKSSKYSNLAPIINRLNPLSYNLDIDKNNKGELKVKHVEIKDDKINIQGLILIPKS